MANFIFVACTLLLLLIGAALADNKLCDCDAQKSCFDDIKEGIDDCFDECEVSADMKNFNETANIGPCLANGRQMIFNLYDCFHTQMTEKESCLSKGKSGGESAKMDGKQFTSLIVKHIKPLADKTNQKLLETHEQAKDKVDFVETAITMHKCAKDCAMDRIGQTKCFEKDNCALNISDEQFKQILSQCMQQQHVKETVIKNCKCFANSGIKNMENYCAQLEKVDFPPDVE